MSLKHIAQHMCRVPFSPRIDKMEYESIELLSLNLQTRLLIESEWDLVVYKFNIPCLFSSYSRRNSVIRRARINDLNHDFERKKYVIE